MALYESHLVVMTNWLWHAWVRKAAENWNCCIVRKQHCAAQLGTGLLLNAPGSYGSSFELPPEAGHALKRLRVARVPASLPMLQLSANVYVGGYIAHIIREHATCDSCCYLTSKTLFNQPLQQLTRNQDRGGLL